MLSTPNLAHTFNVSVTHGFSVLLCGNLQIVLCLHLNKGLSTGTTLSCVGKMDAGAIAGNFAICIQNNNNLLSLHLNEMCYTCAILEWQKEVSIPEKNLWTSSTEQDQGSPLIRTTYPSSAMTDHKTLIKEVSNYDLRSTYTENVKLSIIDDSL